MAFCIIMPLTENSELVLVLLKILEKLTSNYLKILGEDVLCFNL